ncbi:hypothetical protein [Enterococcus ureasiticus]|uniref:hypothetical protein n=1 Tax=Enterococcus ureasiticus TaxID=903984 RepID=UPI001F5F8493|nr:hypothetical protein [Enterococcus ureasiticus]
MVLFNLSIFQWNSTTHNYVSVENTAVRKVYRGYLTLQSNGYAPGNWRVYAGTLYLSGGNYPIPSRAIEDI